MLQERKPQEFDGGVKSTREEQKTELISIIQTQFPVEKHPYQALAEQVDLADAQEAFDLVQELKKDKLVRRIGAIFDSAHLGYKSSLCALAVANKGDFDKVAALVSASPSVTHNYERPGHYNLWFTVTMRSELEILAFLEQIKEQTSYGDYLYLPALKLYKIRVNFDMRKDDASEEGGKPVNSYAGPRIPSSVVVEPFSEFDKALVRLLQADISDKIEPYQAIASQLTEELSSRLGYAVTEDVVLQRIRNWKFNGTIRRFGAAVRHRELGFTHNAMVVWNIPDEVCDKVGAVMASCDEVSHCYERPRRETWPYNFYSMIHGMSEADCEAVAQHIVGTCAQQGMSVEPQMFLYSSRELKKVSMKYFLEEA